MSKSIIYDSSASLDENFGVIGTNLNEILEERIQKQKKEREEIGDDGKYITIVELINKFKMDLKNLNNEDYEKQVPEISIKAIPENIKKQLIKYLNILIERNEKKEKIAIQKKAKEDKRKAKKDNFDERIKQIHELIEKIALQEKIQKSDAIKRVIENLENNMIGIEFTKKERILIIKKLNEMMQKEIEKEAKSSKESVRIENRANNIWNQICETVQKESETGNKTEPECWIAVREQFFGESQINEGKAVEKRVRELLDNEIYYQEVKYFTRDFSFLRDYPETVLASIPRRKFKDRTSYYKYIDLREKLQTTSDEYKKINELLKRDIDDTDRRILTERMNVIEKNRTKRGKER